MRELWFRAMNEVGNWVYFSIWGINPPLDKKKFKNLGEYTGLKDKNKVEIFEGDIVRYLFSDDYSGQGFLEIKHEVELKNGKFYPVCMMDTAYHDFDDKPLIWKDFEVIGNIYENKELLNPATVGSDTLY